MAKLPFAVIPLSLGTIETGNERAERPAVHLGYAKFRSLVWRTAGPANAWVRGDFGADSVVDFCALVLANAQPGTQIRLRLDDAPIGTGGTMIYDSGPVTLVAPAITSDDGLYHSHLELPAATTARYWRIDITGHTGDFEAATLVLGKKLQPATYYNPDFKFDVQDLGDIAFGRWGVPDETPGLVYRILSMKFGWLDTTDMETKFRPLAEQLGKRGIVYFCFDPEATVYRQAKTYLGWLRTPPYATGAAAQPGRYESELELLSQI
jgi:hypothetical protein